MKAIVYHNYGSPDVLKLEEVPKPTPRDDGVLIRVHAASANAGDWHLLRGKPFLVRLMGYGLLKPKNKLLGWDIAGRVETVGRNVTQFKPGDEVFGACSGAFAEYACTSESRLVRKPDNVTFEQAAAAPVAALTALQGLRDKGKIQPGQKILINGAGGGVGTFAVQIAKSFGAEVTAVSSTRNLVLARSIGADFVIDYSQEDFTKSGQRYGLILDCFANHSLFACRRVLNPKGKYIVVGGPSGSMFGLLAGWISALVLSRLVSQKFIMFIAKLSKEDLTVMRDLMQAGKVTPVIDRRYPLSEVPDAIRYLEEGHVQGKVVITM
ncbi:MAG: alcohol dehydrogenase [candidate division Zixibacteria bacterium RBG_16_50_21]|nr:MAG: alcohol dehydrogenase [candidate division Zixibacteria bacterium RBG_16_50_21]